MSRFGSKAHLNGLRTEARRHLGSGSEPPTVEQLLRAAKAIDDAIHATTLSSFGRLMVADGWGFAYTVEEFVRARFDHDSYLLSRQPAVRLVREPLTLEQLFTTGLGAKSAEDWKGDDA